GAPAGYLMHSGTDPSGCMESCSPHMPVYRNGTALSAIVIVHNQVRFSIRRGHCLAPDVTVRATDQSESADTTNQRLNPFETCHWKGKSRLTRIRQTGITCISAHALQHNIWFRAR